MEISEEALNFNETTTESVEETESAENAEILRNWGATSWFLIFLFSLWL